MSSAAPRMIRVVCEYCQTAYNIPETKLAKAVNQATCKVCQNKIVIRREDLPGIDDTGGLSAVLVDHQGNLKRAKGDATAVSPAPRTPSASVGATQRPEDYDVQETELSNSWREAVLDNRSTNQLLKKIGVNVPQDAATASGPKVDSDGNVVGRVPAPTNPSAPESDGTSEMDEEEARAAAKADARPRVVSPGVPRADIVEPAPSAAISALGGLAALLAAATIWKSGAWASVTGILGLFAASFAATAGLANAAIRRRGALAVMGILAVSMFLGTSVIAGAIVTGGDRTRALAERHPALAPLARFAH